MDEGNTWLKSAAGGAAGAASGDLWRHTALKPALDFFDDHLREIGVSLAKAKRAAAERAAAHTGDW